MGSGKPPILVVYSEDASKDAFDTLKALVRKALLVAQPGAQTHLPEFQPASSARRAALTALRWRGADKFGRQARVELAQDIATALARGANEGRVAVVLFHADGDTPWSDRSSSQNVRDVRTLRDLVARLPVEAASLLGFCAVHPHYSIEAWTYQNVAVLRRLHPTLTPAQLETLARWEADPASLEEESRPKGQFSDRWNRKLAETAWPANRAMQAAGSFAALVEVLRDVPGLCDALRGEAR